MEFQKLICKSLQQISADRSQGSDRRSHAQNLLGFPWRHLSIQNIQEEFKRLPRIPFSSSQSLPVWKRGSDLRNVRKRTSRPRTQIVDRNSICYPAFLRGFPVSRVTIFALLD